MAAQFIADHPEVVSILQKRTVAVQCDSMGSMETLVLMIYVDTMVKIVILLYRSLLANGLLDYIHTVNILISFLFSA